MTTIAASRRRVVLVSGQSGAGKSTVLRVLEDLGYEATDNPPLGMLEQIVSDAGSGIRPLALGVDVRSNGFDANRVLEALAALRVRPDLAPELLYLAAEDWVLLRRFTATRRRHPLSGMLGVAEGIAAEADLVAPLRDAADMVLDTTDLKSAELRRQIELRFALSADAADAPGLAITLMSFAFPAGLPREADMVFDARFLRNPFYDPTLATRDGRDPEVAAFVAADPDHEPFLNQIKDMLALVLPRFVTEGKKYVTIAIGCSGGRHRSVSLAEALMRQVPGRLPGLNLRLGVLHRELTRQQAMREDIVSGPAHEAAIGSAGGTSSTPAC